MMPAAWPTPLPRTWASAWQTSRKSWRGSLWRRAELLIGFVDGEIDVQQVKAHPRPGQVADGEKPAQYYLNEQMKAIQKELGALDEAPNELEDLAARIDKAGMPKAVETKARNELGKLKQMSPMSAEATVVRNYLDWLLGVPWSKRSRIRRDLAEAQRVLDADHHGLEKVKERILEYLPQQRVRKLKGPILCLVGPPGVGKTSLGQSIARRRTASSCAYRLAVCAMRRKSAVTGAPTSVRCPAA